ncbi:YbhB/YbcL family Raf kinase inhibitor-like protein [Pendulispora brunnea]|uniref:YbhB/YbcL family Raf kinase inhibitor-like protein n=1 Tax=Pendulispora brunnea TaxID=2905690 RepID=A0ABZ2KGJ2_9BACT
MGMLHQVASVVGRALRSVHAGDDKLVISRLQRSVEAIDVTTSSFLSHGPIPTKYTADGLGLSPPIRWGNVPERTRSLVLICEDPDAPLPKPFVHWLVHSIAPDIREIPEGSMTVGMVGLNTRRKMGYTPPSPPPGHGLHHYHFQLYALDYAPELSSHADREDVVRAMESHVLASGRLIGTYERT